MLFGEEACVWCPVIDTSPAKRSSMPAVGRSECMWRTQAALGPPRRPGGLGDPIRLCRAGEGAIAPFRRTFPKFS